MAIWWDHLVPPLFAGLAAAALSAPLIPGPLRRLLPPLWSFLSLPMVGAIFLHDRLKSGAVTPAQVEQGLLYTNLSNPWLWTDPLALVKYDACLCVLAIWLNHAPPPDIGREDRLGVGRQALLDALSWTTLAGAAMVMVGVGTSWAPFAATGWLDPLLGHWSATHPAPPLLAVGLGGVAGILPVVWYRRRLGLGNRRWLLLRLGQAVGACLLYRVVTYPA